MGLWSFNIPSGTIKIKITDPSLKVRNRRPHTFDLNRLAKSWVHFFIQNGQVNDISTYKTLPTHTVSYPFNKLSL